MGHSVAALRPLLPPVSVVRKTHFSAVSEGGLFRAPEGQRVQWIVAGMEAHVCVQQTVLDLLELHSQYISVGGRCRNGAGAGAEDGIKEKLNDG